MPPLASHGKGGGSLTFKIVRKIGERLRDLVQKEGSGVGAKEKTQQKKKSHKEGKEAASVLKKHLIGWTSQKKKERTKITRTRKEKKKVGHVHQRKCIVSSTRRKTTFSEEEGKCVLRGFRYMHLNPSLQQKENRAARKKTVHKEEVARTKSCSCRRKGKRPKLNYRSNRHSYFEKGKKFYALMEKKKWDTKKENALPTSAVEKRRAGKFRKHISKIEKTVPRRANKGKQ